MKFAIGVMLLCLPFSVLVNRRLGIKARWWQYALGFVVGAGVIVALQRLTN
jgi:hypothetical protein